MAVSKALNPTAEFAAPDVPFSWGKIFLAVFAFAIIGRIQEVIPALGSIRIGLVAGGLAGIMWLLAPGSLENKIPMRIPQVKYVMWLFLLSIVIVPVSVWPGHSVDFILNAYWKVVLFFLMVVFWVRSLGDVRGILWACCIGLCALVLFGLTSGSGYGPQDRFGAGSATYDANDLALVLVMALPLLVYLFSVSNVIFKILSAAMVFICLYGIVLTDSRGGFLALLAVGFLILFRSPVSRATKTGIIALVLIVFVSLAGGHYWDRMLTMWSPQGEYDETAGGRTTVWKTGLRILVTHPWGVGIDNFETAEGLSHGGLGAWNAAHNSFLQLAVDLGVVGFIVFIALIAVTVKDLRRIQKFPAQQTPPKFSRPTFHEASKVMQPATESLLPVASALETTMWGFVVGGFFLSQAYAPMLYCILALSLACKQIHEAQRRGIHTSKETDVMKVWQGSQRTAPVNRS
jgi:O-antigen ligase